MYPTLLHPSAMESYQVVRHLNLQNFELRNPHYKVLCPQAFVILTEIGQLESYIRICIYISIYIYMYTQTHT